VVLSGDNRFALWVPPGFAHGFLVLSRTAIFEYKCTDYYAPGHERAIRWDDPDLGIDWPFPYGTSPQLSEKDLAAAAFKDADTYP
jgi:dTDP-4-dehydrorhamnose 3,5-epimerase